MPQRPAPTGDHLRHACALLSKGNSRSLTWEEEAPSTYCGFTALRGSQGPQTYFEGAYFCSMLSFLSPQFHIPYRVTPTSEKHLRRQPELQTQE